MSDPQNTVDDDQNRPETTSVIGWLEEHGDALFAFAMLRVGKRELAEDLVQDTLLVAIKSFRQFDGRSSIRTWLIGILKRKIVDQFRRNEVEQRHLSAAKQPKDGLNAHRAEPSYRTDGGAWKHDPATTMESAEFWQKFEECRRKLPAKLLSAFVLREIDQASHRDVCQQLGISASNLSVRLYRARLAMRQCLERNWFRSKD